MESQKEKDRKEIVGIVKNVAKDMDRLLDFFQNGDSNIKQVLASEYPFYQSFDELVFEFENWKKSIVIDLTEKE
jgi:hypothetical protein